MVRTAVALAVVLGLWVRAGAEVPAGALRLGPCPDAMPFQGLLLAFEPRDPAGLATLIREQLDPASPRYRAWLTPEEFGERFGPPAEDYAAAAAWLVAHGFTNVRAWPGRLAVGFDGTAGAVAAAFGTPLARFSWSGRTEAAPSGAPALPLFGATRTRSVLGLDGFARVHPSLRESTGDHLAPADVHLVFGLDQVYGAGTNGAGVSIAVIAVTDFLTSDVDLFRSTFGLPPVTLTKRGNGVGRFGSGTEIGEALLDTEWSGAIAPQASLIAEVSTGTEVSALLAAWQDALSHNVAAVLSISFGACEALAGADVTNQVNALAAQSAAQGLSVVVSSGDTGVSDCASIVKSMTAPGVNSLASSPSVTAVGGTTLDPLFDSLGNATGYGGETVWNESAVSGGASGGGRSMFFAKPLYQSGPGVPDDDGRDLPDVAFAASPESPGYLVIGAGNPTPFVVGGTSASAPVWAGFLALVVQHAGGRVGLVNPELYRLGRRQAAGTGPAVFHDVTAGTNDWPGAMGFAAGAGFDLATGWGSFDAPALLAAFGVCAADLECDDGLPCTTDTCTAGGCSNAVLPDGTSCEPEDPCSVRSCSAGRCVAVASRCDDGDPCTADTCDPAGGCSHAVLEDVAGVVCRFPPSGLDTPECAGQRVPRAAGARLGSAHGLLQRATGVAAGKRRRRIVAAVRQLRRVAKLVTRAGRRGRIDDPCESSLLTIVQPIQEGAAGLL